MFNFPKEHIVIKSFSYNEIVGINKIVKRKKFSLLGVSEIQEEVYEEREVEKLHAVIYSVTENNFWYYRIENKNVLATRHLGNKLYKACSVLDDICERFESLNGGMNIEKYSIFTNPENSHIIMAIGKYIETEGGRS